MRKRMLRLWRDDEGIVALEYLLVTAIVGLGLVVGLAAVEGALDNELTDLANAVTTLDQSYSFASQPNGSPSRSGSQAIDSPNSIRTTRPGAPATTQSIRLGNCP